MGQRHNRRRTRPRFRCHRRKFFDPYSLQFDPMQPDPRLPVAYGCTGINPFIYSLPLCTARDFSFVPMAQQWHNKYMAYQYLERPQREDNVKLETDEFRLFGGEPGDDVALCYRMMEFFSGLDYIDP